jgi:hypothetical protein
MLLGCRLEFFVNVPKHSELQNLCRMHDGAQEDRYRTVGDLVVLLQSRIQEQKNSYQDELRLPLSWRPLSYPGRARDVALWQRQLGHLTKVLGGGSECELAHDVATARLSMGRQSG